MREIIILPHPRDARKAAGLTRTELAKRVGCCRGTVMCAERDGKYSRVYTLRVAYLKALGYTEAHALAEHTLPEMP